MVSQIALTEVSAERRMTFAEWAALPEDEAGELVLVTTGLGPA